MGDRYVCRRASRQADATKSRKKRKLNANQSSTAAFRMKCLHVAVLSVLNKSKVRFSAAFEIFYPHVASAIPSFFTQPRMFE